MKDEIALLIDMPEADVEEKLEEGEYLAVKVEILRVFEHDELFAQQVGIILPNGGTPCPVCGTTIESPISPASAVSRHFECECPSCSSKWGNRTCGHCHASFPVIVLKESENRSPERSNEWVDRKFGQDVFATPCVNNQGKWAFICPECNRCT